jgi:hypothetical protein
MARSRFLIILAIALVVSACGTPTQSTSEDFPIGQDCTVQFRRDALGQGASLPTSPLTDSINGATVSIAGKCLKVTPEWIVVEGQVEKYWIPRTAVLLVRGPKIAADGN